MAAVVLTAALTVTVAGCGDSRDYAVPDELCGVAVDADTLAPFLPDGSKLGRRTYDQGPESPRCEVTVDKKRVLYISGDVVTPDVDPFEVKRRSLESMGHPAQAGPPLGAAARIADDGALAVKACTYKGRARKFVVLVDLVPDEPVPGDVEKRRAVLDAFLRSYLPHALDHQGCA
ncbi:hypothetical protein ACPXCE_09560 [Streptomyces sp. DT24]|uniref:hypothetical protein n=1 Tax=Streptomyces sp. DT24 TaxID=3416520 RepID=UPI003CE7605F